MKPRPHVRYSIVLLALLINLICYTDRVCIAVAGPLSRTLMLRTGIADRQANMRLFAQKALDVLIEALEKGKIAYNLDPQRDVETTLREFGQNYIGSICRPGGGSSIRTVMAIAERMPEVGRRFYENVLAKTINSLAEYLQARLGPDHLAIDDCGLAAAQFLQMCQATLFLPFVFQAEPAPSAERIARVVDSATRIFLQTYRAKRA